MDWAAAAAELFSPVALLVAEVVADLVHDGGAWQDVGLVLLLAVTFHNHYEPVG